jgi:hypothetical protein
MHSMKNRIVWQFALFISMLLVYSEYGVSLAQNAETNKVIFYVK